jgi:hypothetical protein
LNKIDKGLWDKQTSKKIIDKNPFEWNMPFYASHLFGFSMSVFSSSPTCSDVCRRWRFSIWNLILKKL